MSDHTIVTNEPDTPGAAEAWAHLRLKVGQISDHLAADRARRDRALPIRGPLVKAGTVPAAGPLVLDLGAPAMGRRWDLRNLSVSDAADVGTAAAGAADVYVGTPLAYGPMAWRWQLPTLPAVEKFSSDQIAVIPGDHLLVVVTTGTAGQVLMARADVLDYPLALPKPVMPL